MFTHKYNLFLYNLKEIGNLNLFTIHIQYKLNTWFALITIIDYICKSNATPARIHFEAFSFVFKLKVQM